MTATIIKALIATAVFWAPATSVANTSTVVPSSIDSHILLETVVTVVSSLITPEASKALVATAPMYLTPETARQHIAGAVVAAIRYKTSPEILLSVAHHESRYKHDVITPEPGRRFSCGVMTPEPLTSRDACLEATRSISTGYIAGARHLRAWLNLCRDHEPCALRGYASAATHNCTRDNTRACIAARDFVIRARLIKTAIERAVRSTIPRSRRAKV